MVCIAFARRGGAAHVTTHHYPGTRAEVRAAAVRDALRGLARLAASDT
jgi:nicotinamide mononucleotide (NMN) deamidase PncC